MLRCDDLQSNLIGQNGDIVQSVSSDINQKYSSLQQQHQEFVTHLNSQLSQLEQQLQTQKQQLHQQLQKQLAQPPPPPPPHMNPGKDLFGLFLNIIFYTPA